MVVTIYLMLLLTGIFSAALAGLFGYLLFRKKKLNALSKHKNAYYKLIYPQVSRYLATGGELPAAAKVFWQAQVMKTILLQAAEVVESGEPQKRLIGLAKANGLVDEAEALIQHPKWWRSAGGIAVAGRLGLVQFVPAIKVHLHSGEWHLLYESAGALCRLGFSPDVVDYMIQNDEHLPPKALVHLSDMVTRSLQGTDHLDEIMERFAEAQPRLQALMIDMIGQRKATRYLPFVTRFTQEKDTNLFLPSLKAVARIGICLAEEPVLKALRSEDWQEKVVAVLVVQKCRLRRAVPVIEELLQDSSWWVRLRAAEALDDLGAQSRLVWISEHHEDPYARAIAAKVLQEKNVKGLLS